MSLQQHKGQLSLNLQAVGENDLKRIVAVQHREILVKNERLKGVEDLVRICSEKEEKLQGWKTRAENYETALRRSDARIAYLNKKLGIGPQTALDIGVVYPGVSRKDFDAVTRENIRLKEALEHIAPTELGGKDIVIVSVYQYLTVLKMAQCFNDLHVCICKKSFKFSLS